MKKILFVFLLICPFLLKAQGPAKKYWHVPDSIIAAYPFTGTLNGVDSLNNSFFFGQSYLVYDSPGKAISIFTYDTVKTGDLVYLSIESTGYYPRWIKKENLQSVTLNRNTLEKVVYDKTQAVSWIDTSGLGVKSIMTEGRASNSLAGKMNKSDTTIYARKTYVSSLYQLKGSYLITTGNGSGLTGLTKSQVGLSNVDNTSDVNKPVSTAQAISIATKLTIPVGTTAQYLRGDGTLATFPTITSPTYNYVSRAINSTSYTPSSTQSYRVYYTIEIACTASIGSSSVGEVVLQYFDGSIWQNSTAQIKNSNTVTLAIALNSVTIQRTTISDEFPANTQLRLNTVTNTGSTTISYIKGKEVLY